MSELILEVKPKFCWLQRAIVNFRKSEALTMLLVMPLLIIIGIIAVQNKYISDPGDSIYMYTFVTMFILFIIICPLVTTLLGFLDKKNFEVTSYKVYNDRIEFEEGFINHKYSSVLFRDIKEIHLDQNFIQSKYNIATIRFVTAANNSISETSIRFQDIENAQLVYIKVKEIHEG